MLVAAGGSAATDGGAGALAELGRQPGARIVVLCDVRTPWEEAAETFGPQKGAGAAQVKRLAARLERLARELPRDPRGVPMGGAAGGLAGGLWACLEATLLPGASFVLDALDFDARMRACRAVIVGEGRLDATTLDGKIAGEIATRARQAGVPAYAIAGSSTLDPFEARILDLQRIVCGSTPAQLELAAMALAGSL
ncbi:MAG: hypothetical protein NVSMB51_00420 [Solirubrobacteraceae bacterium]